MTPLEQELIALLRADSRTPVATLARRLHVARATVNNAMRRLEQERLIVGYTVRLRKDITSNKSVRAWMSIAVDRDGAKQVVSTLLSFPFVTALFDTNGRWDILAELQASNLIELSEALEHIRTTRGIQTSETSIHLATFRDR